MSFRDMNVVVSATDMSSIEVLATGLPVHHGAQLAVDITLRSALTSASHACPNAATFNAAVLVKARADKERKYAELVNGDRCRLVVVGVETGGRWSDEAVTFFDHLASARGTSLPSGQRVFHVATSLVAHACSCMRQSFSVDRAAIGRLELFRGGTGVGVPAGGTGPVKFNACSSSASAHVMSPRLQCFQMAIRQSLTPTRTLNTTYNTTHNTHPSLSSCRSDDLSMVGCVLASPRQWLVPNNKGLFLDTQLARRLPNPGREAATTNDNTKHTLCCM